MRCPVPSFVKVSIHAPTWGATDKNSALLPKMVFQSTHPRGVRRSCKHITIPISMFQSTHPRGVRLVASGVPSSTSWFQSTHPRGVRQSTKRNFIKRGSFNPRTHVGCDNTVWELSQRAKSFNPRTHVGCDTLSKPGKSAVTGFNPRTHVGCDYIMPSTIQASSVSIHAPTWGATTLSIPSLPK